MSAEMFMIAFTGFEACWCRYKTRNIVHSLFCFELILELQLNDLLIMALLGPLLQMKKKINILVSIKSWFYKNFA